MVSFWGLGEGRSKAEAEVREGQRKVLKCGEHWTRLGAMEEAAEHAPSAGSSSFAGLLAALTGAKAEAPWDDSELADDVATLSYERALQAHGRYKAPDPADLPGSQTAGAAKRAASGTDAEAADLVDADRVGSTAPGKRAAGLEREAGGRGAETNRNASGAKSASVTIRLSQGECAQLKARAAEAGMTISAYMRSCTFEAEALRAQVKEALAALRAGGSDGRMPEKAAEELADVRRRWWARILPHGR